MNKNQIISQTANKVITGDYTFKRHNYNAIIECSFELFENYIANLQTDKRIRMDVKDGYIDVYLNKTAVCSYDENNGIMFMSIPTDINEMQEDDAVKFKSLLESYSPEEIEDAMNDIVTEDESVTISDKEIVLEFISFLEGYALRFKEFHWDSRKKAMHENAEKAYNLVFTLEDSIAEDMMGFTGSKIKPGDIAPVMPADTLSPPQDNIKVDFVTTLKMLTDDTFSFYKKIENNNNFIGIRSELENFLHELRQLTYLAKMS